MVVPTPALTSWRAAALTDRGLRRVRNEDAFLVRPEARLYAVGDGMGGHAAGDVASRLAISILSDAFPRAPSPRIGVSSLSRRLVSAFTGANEALLEHAARDIRVAGMGTTLTALVPLVAQPRCVIAHIGDSRAYRLHAGELVQITHDHTWVQQQVDAGMLSAQQARHHPWAPLLNRVLGTPALGPPDTYVADAAAGDVFLLCSDGLTGMLTDDDIATLLARPLEPERHAHDLIDAANARGGADNITVVVLRVE